MSGISFKRNFLLKSILAGFIGILLWFIFMNELIAFIAFIVTIFILSKFDSFKLETEEGQGRLKEEKDVELKTIKLSEINIEKEVL